MPKMAVCKGYS